MSELDATIRTLCAQREFDRATSLFLKTSGATVYRYIQARVRDEALTADAFARFSEDLWRGMSSFEGRAPIKVWAYTLARNAAGQVLRKSNRERRRRADWTSTLSRRVADKIRTETRDYLRTDFKNRLREIATRLSPEEQGLLVLRVNERMNWDDIARVSSDLEDPAEVKREAARLRKRFQLVRDKLRKLAKAEGLVLERDR